MYRGDRPRLCDGGGNSTTTFHDDGIYSTAQNNSLLYRGYYFDDILNLYCVGTRYYDANIGRWINADSALYHSMLGYNMYAYCDNNPINYYDPTGESAVSAAVAWTSSMWWLTTVDGVLPVGDIVFWGTAAILTITAGVVTHSVASNTPADTPTSTTDDPPKSINEPEDQSTVDDAGNVSQQSSPGKMQREVEKGKAPKEVKRVDSPKNGKPHIHFKDGTSMNNDGTPHDKSHGTPNLSNKVRQWLGKHNWPTEIKFFP